MTSETVTLYAVRMIGHLADPALRSILLACVAALLLGVFRVRSLAARLTVWTWVLYAASAMPVLGWLLPALPLHLSVPVARLRTINQAAATQQPGRSRPSRDLDRALQGRPVMSGAAAQRAAPNLETEPRGPGQSDRSGSMAVAGKGFQSEALLQPSAGMAPVKHSRLASWALSSRAALAGKMSAPVAALAAYTLGLAILLGRLVVGLFFSHRLLEGATRIGEPRAQRWLEWHTLAMGLRRAPILGESRAVSVPLTLGVLRPSILIPSTWREWPSTKLAAVIAHEVSHVKRNDPRTRALALIYRCFFWFSPLAWWLEHHLTELAEQASDQAAIIAGTDPTYYAEVLMSFFGAIRSGQGRVNWQGVSMARSLRAEDRIDRVLSLKGTVPNRWKGSLALLVALCALPIVYLTATTRPALVDASPSTLAPSAAVAGTQIPAPGAPAGPPAPSSASAGPGAKPGPAPPAPSSPPAPPRPGAIPTPSAPQAPEPVASPLSAIAPSADVVDENARTFNGNHEGMEFAIVSGESIIMMNGSGDDRDAVKSLQKKIQGDFIWFIHGGHSYVIRDAAMVKSARELYASQQDLGRKQEELGKQQEELGKQQEALGKEQEAVRVQIPGDLEARLKKAEAMVRALGTNASQEDLGRLQGELGNIQGEIGNLQGKAGDEQGEIGRRQGELGKKQGELGRLQGELGREQHRLAREATRRMETMLKHALDTGLAQRAPE